jgi:hypothetical protein
MTLTPEFARKEYEPDSSSDDFDVVDFVAARAQRINKDQQATWGMM